MHRYRDLEVWRKAIEVSTSVYGLTATFPNEEKYGLISQLRRSSVSIASNIAEGAGRNSKLEFANFLGIAVGSLFELETQLHISKNVGMVDDNDILEFDERINFNRQYDFQASRKIETILIHDT